MLTRRIAVWRVVAPLLATVQVAAVTFVPVAHPFLHYRPTGAAESRACLAAAAPDAPGLGDGGRCPACLASAGITTAPAGAPVTTPRTRRLPSGGIPDGVLPGRSCGPANRVRAPPLA
jgi:hypothetical protein